MTIEELRATLAHGQGVPKTPGAIALILRYLRNLLDEMAEAELKASLDQAEHFMLACSETVAARLCEVAADDLSASEEAAARQVALRRSNKT